MRQQNARWTLWLFGICAMFSGCSCSKANTAPPPGNITAFDPVLTFAAVRTFADPGAALVQLRAEKVLPNGTLNLEAPYAPSVSYDFVTKATEAHKAQQPVAAPGTAVKARDYMSVRVTITKPYTEHVVDMRNNYSVENLGMERYNPMGLVDNTDVVPPPGCPFSSLFKKIPDYLKQKEDSADITYDKRGYTLLLTSSKARYEFDMGCNLTTEIPRNEPAEADNSPERPSEETAPTPKGVALAGAFGKPLLETTADIVWQGKAKSATGTMRGLKSKGCRLSLKGEKGQKSEITVKCGSKVVYDSKDKDTGGFVNYLIELIEVLPQKETDGYRYKLVYRDIGDRKARAQADINTGARSKVYGEDPPDYVLGIDFQPESAPIPEAAMFPDANVTTAPIFKSVTLTQGDEALGTKTGDTCTLGLAPYGLGLDRDLFCIAELVCGNKAVYGQKTSVQKRGGNAMALTPCTLNPETQTLTGTSDRYNTTSASDDKLKTDLQKQVGTLEKGGTTIAFEIAAD